MDSQPGSIGDLPQVVVVGVFASFLALTIGLVIISFLVGPYTVYFTALSSAYDWSTPSRQYLWIGPFPVFLPFTLPVGVSFLALTAIYAAMLGLSSKQGRSPIASVAAAFKSGFASFFSSPFVATIVAIGFLIFTASVVDSVVSGAGIPVGSLQGDPLSLLLSFTTAPLVEELGFRVLMVGLVAVALSLGRPRLEVLRALWRPSAAYENGASQAVVKAALLAAVVVSSVIFGIAHTASGAWEFGKAIDATYGGLVLAYLYVKYGFHVSVLTHWGVNYLGSVYAFYGQGAFGIPWDSSPGFVLQQLVDLDMLYLFGLGSFLVVVYVGLRRFAARRTELAEAQV